MIVDCHVNIWNDDEIADDFLSRTNRVRPAGDDGVGPKADAETIHSEMETVDKAIVFPIRYGDSIGIEGKDQTCADAVRKYPEKLVGFAYYDPRDSDAFSTLRNSIEELGLAGVKFGPIYNRVHLDDPRLVPLYEYLVGRNLPLTLHMGVTYADSCPIDYGRPIHVDNLSMRYPDLKIIMAHLAHPWIDECLVTIRHAPNVYAEISAIYYRPWQFYNALISAEEYGVTDKIFWGTDFPFARVSESRAGLNNVNHVTSAGMPKVSDETTEMILHSNPFEHWWHGGYRV